MSFSACLLCIILLVFSYTGHENTKYGIDNCLSAQDTHIISGSEDGRICFWDLVEVCIMVNVCISYVLGCISTDFCIV